MELARSKQKVFISENVVNQSNPNIWKFSTMMVPYTTVNDKAEFIEIFCWEKSCNVCKKKKNNNKPNEALALHICLLIDRCADMCISTNDLW